MTIDRHTLALISIVGNCLDVLGALYLAYDLLGGEQGPLRTFTRGVTYGIPFGIAYGVVLGPIFGSPAASRTVSRSAGSSTELHGNGEGWGSGTTL